MTKIVYFGLFWTQIRVSRDLFTDLTAGKAMVRTFLLRLLTAASRSQNCTYRNIITYQTPQSNFPNAILLYIYVKESQSCLPGSSNPVLISATQLIVGPIRHLTCMRIAIKTIFLVSVAHVYTQNGFEIHK